MAFPWSLCSACVSYCAGERAPCLPAQGLPPIRDLHLSGTSSNQGPPPIRGSSGLGPPPIRDLLQSRTSSNQGPGIGAAGEPGGPWVCRSLRPRKGSVGERGADRADFTAGGITSSARCSDTSPRGPKSPFPAVSLGRAAQGGPRGNPATRPRRKRILPVKTISLSHQLKHTKT